MWAAAQNEEMLIGDLLHPVQSPFFPRFSPFSSGDSDSTGVIAASCFGALYGFKGVPVTNYDQLEYHDRIAKLSQDIYNLRWGWRWKKMKWTGRIICLSLPTNLPMYDVNSGMHAFIGHRGSFIVFGSLHESFVDFRRHRRSLTSSI